MLWVLAAQVVDTEALEIADDDEVGALWVGQAVRVALGLLVGRDHGALPRLRFVEVDVGGLLLHERAGLRNEDVNKPAGRGLLLEDRCGGCSLDPDDAAKQIDPEGLGLALLVSVTAPALRKGSRG